MISPREKRVFQHALVIAFSLCAAAGCFWAIITSWEQLHDPLAVARLLLALGVLFVGTVLFKRYADKYALLSEDEEDITRAEMDRADQPSALLGGLKFLITLLVAGALGLLVASALYRTEPNQDWWSSMLRDWERSPTGRAWIITAVALSVIASIGGYVFFSRDEDKDAMLSAPRDIYETRRRRREAAARASEKALEQGGQLSVSPGEESTRGALSEPEQP